MSDIKISIVESACALLCVKKLKGFQCALCVSELTKIETKISFPPPITIQWYNNR